MLAQRQGGVRRVKCVKELEKHRETLQSDIDRGLSLSIWASERFSMYVSGQNFELETDHKPLERIHSCASKPCARVEKWGDRAMIS